MSVRYLVVAGLLALPLSACPSPAPPAPEAGSGSGAGAGATAEAAATAAGSGSGAAAPAEASAPAAEQADPLAAPADVAAAPSDATVTASGLAYKVLTPGSGTGNPGPRDIVSVHYTGWTTDGQRFDSSVERGQPAEFPLDRVIAGWTEGMQLMTPGQKNRFWIPVELAYNNRPGRPAGMLVFDVELLSVTAAPEAPAVPEDVAAIPANAEVTATGLASRVLTPGTGTAHPAATSVVKVHYSGWTTDGQMFDSSIMRGEPAIFPLNGVIPGWTEGVQLMVAGEKRRFWIPVELAYNNAPGAPAGMLVFDVELVEIVQP
jgi:FKBP-type peptidyl-prolyl cis-trans isomerase